MSLKLTSKDVVLWNALISGYTKCGDVEKVICCIEKMQQEGVSLDTTPLVCSL